MVFPKLIFGKLNPYYNSVDRKGPSERWLGHESPILMEWIKGVFTERTVLQLPRKIPFLNCNYCSPLSRKISIHIMHLVHSCWWEKQNSFKQESVKTHKDGIEHHLHLLPNGSHGQTYLICPKLNILIHKWGIRIHTCKIIWRLNEIMVIKLHAKNGAQMASCVEWFCLASIP